MLEDLVLNTTKMNQHNSEPFQHILDESESMDNNLRVSWIVINLSFLVVGPIADHSARFKHVDGYANYVSKSKWGVAPYAARLPRQHPQTQVPNLRRKSWRAGKDEPCGVTSSNP